MSYITLLQISLQHAYYSDGVCPDLAISVSAASRHLLDGHRCLVRADAGRLRILAPVDAAGKLPIPFSAPTTLRFELVLQNPEFSLFTDLSELAAQSAPLFVPGDAASLPAGQLVLAESPDPLLPTGCFAAIELPCPVAADGLTVQPATYFLPFRARELRWAYYCVTSSSTDPSQLHIVDAAPSGSDDLLSFSDSNRADLRSEPDSSDSTATQLLQQYPTLRCVRFLSDQPISCRQQPRAYLELRLGEERLLGPLPNPSPRSVAGGVLLFRVIKYRTQPLLTQ